MTARPAGTVARPWRAVASIRLAPGLRPITVARCYRATEEGLSRFVQEYEATGHTVSTWKVEPIPEVAAQLVAATAPSPSVPSSP